MHGGVHHALELIEEVKHGRSREMFREVLHYYYGWAAPGPAIQAQVTDQIIELVRERLVWTMAGD